MEVVKSQERGIEACFATNVMAINTFPCVILCGIWRAVFLSIVLGDYDSHIIIL
jgi:hypothetical protein